VYLFLYAGIVHVIRPASRIGPWEVRVECSHHDLLGLVPNAWQTPGSVPGSRTFHIVQLHPSYTPLHPLPVRTMHEDIETKHRQGRCRDSSSEVCYLHPTPSHFILSISRTRLLSCTHHSFTPITQIPNDMSDDAAH